MFVSCKLTQSKLQPLSMLNKEREKKQAFFFSVCYNYEALLSIVIMCACVFFFSAFCTLFIRWLCYSYTHNVQLQLHICKQYGTKCYGYARCAQG